MRKRLRWNIGRAERESGRKSRLLFGRARDEELSPQISSAARHKAPGSPRGFPFRRALARSRPFFALPVLTSSSGSPPIGRPLLISHFPPRAGPARLPPTAAPAFDQFLREALFYGPPALRNLLPRTAAVLLHKFGIVDRRWRRYYTVETTF